ncbi:hypothetical protein ACTWJ9_30700 (plasmid) [Streptomyces sp. GDS52]|uniref:hypothetical protein n=1 Tax=Streptomyces sp. GDS52 TaxID=3406419 RepID=UPI003FD411AA
MNPILIWPTVVLSSLVIVAATAALVARFALHNTKSEHRAAVLAAVADIVKAVRGKR